MNKINDLSQYFELDYAADLVGGYVDPPKNKKEKERLDKLTAEFIKQYKAKEHSKK